MINFGPTFQLKKYISASRLDAYCFCSAKYAASYIYKLPDKGNSGSSRGDCVHRILELLGSKKRKALIPKLIKADSVRSFQSLWRLVRIYAKQKGVDNETDLKLIDFFIITGLIWDKEPEGVIETLIEKEFSFEVFDEKKGLKYRLLGYIDKVYLINRNGKKYILILDFKTSKDKFKKEKKENNVQSLIYQLVTRYLFPEYELISFDFLFLKFRKDPIQTTGVYSNDILDGFEHYLTEIQSQMERFSVSNCNDNIAQLDYSKKALCGSGKEGFKDDGSPIWICPARKPMNYWVELDESKGIKKSYFEKPEGVITEKRSYPGCSFFFDSQGQPQTLTFQ